MSDRLDDNPPREPSAANPPQDSLLWRLLADDELDAAGRAALGHAMAGNPELARAAREHVAFEQRLREAVSKSMGSQRAPEAVRDAIAQMLASAPSLTQTETETETDAGQGSLTLTHAEGSLNGSSRSGGRVPTSLRAASKPRAHVLRRVVASPWRSPHRANVLAVAAVLALISGAVLFGIYGRTIDDVPPAQSPVASDIVGNAAEFADKEHSNCAGDQREMQRRIQFRSAEEAASGLTDLLGAPVHVYDLSSLGYEFIGAGTAGMPFDKQHSGRLMYRKKLDGKPDPMVSIFMSPARGPARGMASDMKPREWRKAPNSRCQRRVMYSTDRKLVYFLVCDDSDLDRVRELITLAQATEPAAQEAPGDAPKP